MKKISCLFSMHCKHLGKVWERKRNIITSNEDAKDSLQPASVGGGAVQPNGFRNIVCGRVCPWEAEKYFKGWKPSTPQQAESTSI